MGCGQLTTAVEALVSESPIGLADDVLCEQLLVLGRVKAQLAAYEAAVTGAFDSGAAWRHDGSRNATVWLVRNCRMSRPAAAAQVRLGRRLPRMHATRKALAAGEITQEHAIRLAKLAFSSRRPVRTAFPEAEATLVDQAKGLLFREFETVTSYWEDLVDPDGTETQAADDYDARELHASELMRGLVRIDGTLDPVGGAVFLTELVRLERQMFQEDWAKAKVEHGDATTVEKLWRTNAQRRADALSEMARRSARATIEPADTKKRGPLFVVHIGPDIPARMCELASGKVIAPGLLVPHLGTADIERIVYGPKKRILELSKTAPYFRGALKRAMQLRDRFCTMPGCGILGEHAEVDHIKPRSQGGQTTQTNGRIRCGPDNRWAFYNEQRYGSPDDPDPPDTS